MARPERGSTSTWLTTAFWRTVSRPVARAACSVEPGLLKKGNSPQAPAALARQIVAFVQGARRLELQKKPGIAETLDWTAALLRMDVDAIGAAAAEPLMDTLGALVKTRDDRAAFTPEVVARLAAAC